MQKIKNVKGIYNRKYSNVYGKCGGAGIKVITNTPITISEEEEIDMCQAVDEMIEDGREEGRMKASLRHMQVL